MNFPAPTSYALRNFCCASLFFVAPVVRSEEALEKLRVNEVVKVVEVMQPGSKKKVRPKVSDQFGVPEILSTGAGSRAELLAVDGTVTRVGANSVFYFSPGRREVNLEKGTILFHSPSGKGGGVVRSAGATAGVLGTSIIVSATKNGGFKLLVLEGKAKATLPNGQSLNVGAGQLTFVMPGSRQFGPVVNFRLKDQVAGSNLVKGFKAPLASLPKITEAVATQERKIAAGRIDATNFLVDDTNLVQVVANSASLGRTRLTDAETALEEGSQPVSGSFSSAIARDLAVTNGGVDKSHMFTYRNDAIPPQLLALLGETFKRQSVAYAPDYVHAYLVGNNVSILGDQKVDLFANAPSSAEGFVVAAQNALLFNEGLSSGSNPGLQDPFALVAARTGAAGAPETAVPGDKSLWAVAGKSITVSNSLLASSSDWKVFGNYYEAYPPIQVSVSDSAIVNYYANGSVNLGGNSVKITNSNIISRGQLTVYAGEIDITSETGRQILAGYRGVDSAGASFSTLKMKADRDLKVKNVTMGAASVALDATTITLQDVTFKAGSVVSLVSGNGQANFGSVQPRAVNFVSNVRYGTSPIQSAEDSNLRVTDTTKPVATPATPGVYLYKNNR